MCLPYKYYSSLRSHISFHVKPSPNIKQLSSAKCLSGLNMHLSALTLYSTSNFSLAKQLLTKPFPALKLVSRLLVVSVDLWWFFLSRNPLGMLVRNTPFRLACARFFVENNEFVCLIPRLCRGFWSQSHWNTAIGACGLILNFRVVWAGVPEEFYRKFCYIWKLLSDLIYVVAGWKRSWVIIWDLWLLCLVWYLGLLGLIGSQRLVCIGWLCGKKEREIDVPRWRWHRRWRSRS